jgi:hypothetical protein
VSEDASRDGERVELLVTDGVNNRRELRCRRFAEAVTVDDSLEPRLCKRPRVRMRFHAGNLTTLTPATSGAATFFVVGAGPLGEGPGGRRGRGRGRGKQPPSRLWEQSPATGHRRAGTPRHRVPHGIGSRGSSRSEAEGSVPAWFGGIGAGTSSVPACLPNEGGGARRLPVPLRASRAGGKRAHSTA